MRLASLRFSRRRLPGFLRSSRIPFALATIGLLAACNPTVEPPVPDGAEAPAGQVSAADADAGPGTVDATPATGVAATGETPRGKRAAGEENLPMNAWRAFGNEPFWSVRVDGDTLVFSTPEDQAGRALRGRRVPSLVGVVYVGTDESGRDFNLDIQPGECSDGMSDNTYQHVSTFIYGGTTYRGCAEAAK